MIIALIIAAVIILTVYLFMQLPQFGKAATGKRLERMKQSANFKNGAFQNIHYTPTLAEGYSMSGVLYNFLFKKHPRTKPNHIIPSVKTDLKSIPADNKVLIWFGHSSYFLQIEGKRLLIDPVFSGHASPVRGFTKAFPGADAYSAGDMPEIDYLLISHDHYDHLDYKTIIQLKPKVKHVICGLGVGEHFEHWGFDSNIIIEKDWNETLNIDNNFKLHTAPARHFSGRKLNRNATLWLSFILETPHLKIYLGGDSGYDTHFAEIGKKFGPFDLVILDNGQYNEAWRLIHMLPEDVIQAAADLRAKRLLPVHSSKFKLSIHPWDEPMKKVTELKKDLPVITPMIGEVVYIDDKTQVFKEWWKDIN